MAICENDIDWGLDRDGDPDSDDDHDADDDHDPDCDDDGPAEQRRVAAAPPVTALRYRRYGRPTVRPTRRVRPGARNP